MVDVNKRFNADSIVVKEPYELESISHFNVTSPPEFPLAGGFRDLYIDRLDAMHAARDVLYAAESSKARQQYSLHHRWKRNRLKTQDELQILHSEWWRGLDYGKRGRYKDEAAAFAALEDADITALDADVDDDIYQQHITGEVNLLVSNKIGCLGNNNNNTGSTSTKVDDEVNRETFFPFVIVSRLSKECIKY
jgi:hypothetical protein